MRLKLAAQNKLAAIFFVVASKVTRPAVWLSTTEFYGDFRGPFEIREFTDWVRDRARNSQPAQLLAPLSRKSCQSFSTRGSLGFLKTATAVNFWGTTNLAPRLFHFPARGRGPLYENSFRLHLFAPKRRLNLKAISPEVVAYRELTVNHSNFCPAPFGTCITWAACAELGSPRQPFQLQCEGGSPTGTKSAPAGSSGLRIYSPWVNVSTCKSHSHVGILTSPWGFVADSAQSRCQ